MYIIFLMNIFPHSLLSKNTYLTKDTWLLNIIFLSQILKYFESTYYLLAKKILIKLDYFFWHTF